MFKYSCNTNKLKGDLNTINIQTRRALDDPNCSQVIMITERQGALVKIYMKLILKIEV